MIGGRSALLSAAGGGSPYGNWTGNYEDVSLLLRNETQKLVPLDESPSPVAITAFNKARNSLVVKKYGNSSMWLGGNGDYFAIGSQSILNVGTGNFTVEFYVYVLPVSSVYGRNSILSPTEATRSTGVVLSLQGTTQGSSGLQIIINGTTVINYTTAITPSQWAHIALVRSGTGANGLKLYINGANVASATSAANVTNAIYNIGALKAVNPTFDDFFTGYIDDLRITKNVARYTSNFTPPAAELPANSTDDIHYANVSLLLRNGTPTAELVPFDESPRAKDIILVGDAGIATSTVKYGTSSVSFDGSGDYAYTIGTSTDFIFGTGSFTIEFWVGFPTVSGSGIIMDFRGRGTATTIALPNIARSGSQLTYVVNNITVITGGSLLVNTWYHVAVCRSGASTRMFLDGTQIGLTYSDSTDYLCGTNRPIIGADGNNPTVAFSQMFIDDLRITKGVARYTRNFLPPPAELPAI